MGQLWEPTVMGRQIKLTVFDGQKYISLPTQSLGEWGELTFSVWVKAYPYSGNGYPAFLGSYTDVEARKYLLRD